MPIIKSKIQRGFCEQLRIYGKVIKKVGYGKRIKTRNGFFYVQSHIYEKVIKKTGYRKRIKFRNGFFYVQSHIYEKVIKKVDCRKQDKIRRGIFCGKNHIFEKYIKSRFDPARSYAVDSVILLSTDIPFFVPSMSPRFV